MYPGTIFNWHDQSVIPTSTAVSIDNAPLFLTASSFDKGPEDLRVVRGQLFYDLYGTDISFKKHGQPAIQAANIINAGGSLLIKRLVANDATLANTILVMTITSNIVATPVGEGEDDSDAKTISEIKEMYSSVFETPLGDGEGDLDPSDVPTTDDPGETSEDTQKYKTNTKTIISWSAVSVTGSKTIQEVYDYAITLVEKDAIAEVEDETLETGQIKLQAKEVIPVFVIADNGRGVSNKSIRFIPDYTTSKNSESFYYNIRIYEGTSISEKVYASVNPEAVSNNKNMGISLNTSVQLVTEEVEGAYQHIVDVLAKSTGLTEEEIKSSDILFGYNNRKVGLPGIEIDPESIDLNSSYGINLENGSNGSFGNAPFETDAYKKAASWFFYPVSEEDTTGEGVLYDYEGSDKIFDVDEYHIAACFDANYPFEVKEAISKLVTFREDFVFFRDLGLDVYNYNSIVSYASNFSIKNKFTADYATTYQIFNPSGRKRIRVTMMYDFAAAMVNHFINGPYRPLAGTINDMVLPSAIEGTVNYTPRITPVVNQKDLMELSRINYAIFQSGQCVVQSLYTAQNAYTQLSYINNVLAIQQVVRAVRIACPKFRYSFVSGNDFSDYAEAVTNVLSNFLTNFTELSFEYQEDDFYASQKIFYGVINFRFNNWAQTEVFDLYALPTVAESTEI